MNSLQKIFDAAWQEFIVENNPPALTIVGDCAYLTPDGKRCAVGLCIPDGHPAQKCGGFLDFIVNTYDLFPDLKGYPDHCLVKFQTRLHDSLCDSKEWIFTLEERKQKYIQIAKDYSLEIPSENQSS